MVKLIIILYHSNLIEVLRLGSKHCGDVEFGHGLRHVISMGWFGCAAEDKCKLTRVFIQQKARGSSVLVESWSDNRILSQAERIFNLGPCDVGREAISSDFSGSSRALSPFYRLLYLKMLHFFIILSSKYTCQVWNVLNPELPLI